jgi:hypothetical protein
VINVEDVQTQLVPEGCVKGLLSKTTSVECAR